MHLTTAKLRYVLLRWSGVLALLALWEIAPRLGWADAQFLPALSTTLQAVKQLGLNGSLYSHLVVSLWRVLTGLLLAVAVAVPLAFILEGWFAGLSRQLDPLFRLLSHVNPFSLAPVFILFFGIGEAQKLAIISLVTVWPILFHTITGIRAVDPLLVKTARSLHVSRFRMARDVLLPAAFPTIITGLRVGTQMAVFMLVAAEMLGASAGMGWLVHNSAMNYQIPRMYAGGGFIILLGIGINQFILQLERDSFFWQTPPALLDQRSERQIPATGNTYYLPMITGVLIGILFFGGQEVARVNSQAAASGFTAEQHSHHHTQPDDGAANAAPPEGHNHHMSMPGHGAEQEGGDKDAVNDKPESP